jgi:hypothetical protein
MGGGERGCLLMVMEVSNSFVEDIFRIIPRSSTILELGSGATTQTLSQRYNMISIEENIEYLHKDRSTYIHAPLQEHKRTKQFPEEGCNLWYNSDVIRKEVPTLRYDALVIDGPSKGNHRAGLWKYRSLFNWDVPIFVDDLNNEIVWRLVRHLCRDLGISDVQIKDIHYRKCYGILRGAT